MSDDPLEIVTLYPIDDPDIVEQQNELALREMMALANSLNAEEKKMLVSAMTAINNVVSEYMGLGALAVGIIGAKLSLESALMERENRNRAVIIDSSPKESEP